MYDYYNDYGAREICHGVKVGNRECILEMASYLSKQIDSSSVIIPIPQHGGKAEYTKEIAMLISKWTRASVADILRSIPHEAGYILKKQGKAYKPKFYTVNKVPDANVVLIDNVLATGITIQEAKRVIGNCDVQVYACDFQTRKEKQNG